VSQLENLQKIAKDKKLAFEIITNHENSNAEQTWNPAQGNSIHCSEYKIKSSL
jgi:hypothetical protein